MGRQALLASAQGTSSTQEHMVGGGFMQRVVELGGIDLDSCSFSLSLLYLQRKLMSMFH